MLVFIGSYACMAKPRAGKMSVPTEAAMSVAAEAAKAHAERAAQADRLREEIGERRVEKRQMREEADEQRMDELRWMNDTSGSVPVPTHVRYGKPWYGVDNAEVTAAQDYDVPH